MTGGMEKCYQWNGTMEGIEKSYQWTGKQVEKGFPGGSGNGTADSGVMCSCGFPVISAPSSYHTRCGCSLYSRCGHERSRG